MKIQIDLGTPRARRVGRALVVLGVVLAVGAPFIAIAGPPVNLTFFTPGTPISSTDVNNNFAAIQNAIQNTNGPNQLVSLNGNGDLQLPSGGNVFCSAAVNAQSAQLQQNLQVPTISCNQIQGFAPTPGTLNVLPTLNAQTGVTTSTLTAPNMLTISSGAAGIQVQNATTFNAATTFSGAATFNSTAQCNGTFTVGTIAAAGGTTLAVSNGLTVNGNFTVTGGTKSFADPHPTDSTKAIVYVCLEGGEAGVYCRGTGQLANGRATITLPEHFALVASPDQGLTVMLTPTAPCSGLYVVKKGTAAIEVASSDGSDATFDWMVNGLRKGYENHVVIQEKSKYFPEHVESRHAK
jgi:hypothetical protein